jgi:hypothetical protein
MDASLAELVRQISMGLLAIEELTDEEYRAIYGHDRSSWKEGSFTRPQPAKSKSDAANKELK